MVIDAKIKSHRHLSGCTKLTGKNDDVINLSSLDLSSKLTPLFATNVFKTDDW
jgi:hypothetical protein